MEKINSKEDLINYFKKGCKKEDQVSVGVEHEKFLFDESSNKRINFEMVSKIFHFLEQFGWNPKKENNNVIALHKDGQSITLEPGNVTARTASIIKYTLPDT